MTGETISERRYHGARRLVYLAEDLGKSLSRSGVLGLWKHTRDSVLPEADFHTLLISTPTRCTEIVFSDSEIVDYPYGEGTVETVLRMRTALLALVDEGQEAA